MPIRKSNRHDKQKEKSSLQNKDDFISHALLLLFRLFRRRLWLRCSGTLLYSRLCRLLRLHRRLLMVLGKVLLMLRLHRWLLVILGLLLLLGWWLVMVLLRGHLRGNVRVYISLVIG